MTSGCSDRTAGAPVRIRALRGRRRLLRLGVAGVVGLAVALGASNAWVGLASRGGVHRPEDVPHRPVAIVLGAGVYPDGRPQPFLAARLDVAADLLRRGRVDRLIVSGDGRHDHHDEPGAMRRYLLAHGVPAERITEDPEGRDTWASCVRAVQVYGVREATLVSQTYHLPRALALARAAGLDAVGVGDETMASAAPTVWAEGVARERLAALKAAFDALTRRDPVLGTPHAQPRRS